MNLSFTLERLAHSSYQVSVTTTMLSARAWEKIGLSTRLTPTPKKPVSVQGNLLQLLGATQISIMLQEQELLPYQMH